MPYCRKRIRWIFDEETRENQGQIAQYYVENNHPAIVKPEIWEAVQLEEQRRREYMKLHHIKAYSSDLANNPFASKIICGECGEAFGRKNGDHARVNIEVSGNARYRVKVLWDVLIGILMKAPWKKFL